jgi:environmental stress-induced protein Ves
VEVIICVRTDIDWASMTQQKMQAQDATYRPIAAVDVLNASGIIAMWNKMFNMEWFAFRQKIADLARKNLAAITGCRVIVGQDAIQKELHKDEDAWLVPTDDDDWFLPDKVQDLGKLAPRADLLIWPKAVIREGRVIILSSNRNRKWWFSTNNYAVSKRLLMGANKDESMMMKEICWHAHARRLMGCCRHHRVLPGKYSMVNRHSASPTITHDLIVRSDKAVLAEMSNHRRYRVEQGVCNDLVALIRRQCKMPRIPPGVRWATPYIRETVLLHRALL